MLNEGRGRSPRLSLQIINIKKNKMKSKIIVFVMMMFIAVSSLQAQATRRTPEERAKQSVDRMNDSLKLNTKQHTEAQAALSQFYMAQDQLRSGLEPGVRPERTAVEKLVEIRDGKLKLILTEAQFAKYKELDAAMRQRSQRPPGQ